MQRLHDTFATWNRIVLAASRGRVFLLLDCTAPWRFLGSRDLLVVLLRDRVADNLTFRDLTESETLLIGRNFGVVTDIEPGPRGTLFVMSLDQGAIYEISRAGGRGGDDEDRSEQIGTLTLTLSRRTKDERIATDSTTCWQVSPA